MKVKKKMEIKIIFDYKLRQTDRQRKLKICLFIYIHENLSKECLHHS